jgi:hypothetical protein
MKIINHLLLKKLLKKVKKEVKKNKEKKYHFQNNIFFIKSNNISILHQVPITTLKFIMKNKRKAMKLNQTIIMQIATVTVTIIIILTTCQNIN